ncbi:hypothetical protein MIR68_011805 [Amoeboaphelidium protococcarum]|nr:hypothetical protein MIR68_011805 [Amoeboaphelidium protococcarum]
MRDSRFAVNSFAAACKLAKQVVTVLNGVIFAALLSYTIAIGIVLGGVNAAIAALLVGWPPILSPLMAAYWVAMKDINLNEANIENDKHLQQSLDNLLQLKTD